MHRDDEGPPSPTPSNHYFSAYGALPLDPDGVPPLSLALRGGSHLYHPRKTVECSDRPAADASLGTNKIGVWGLRPQRGPGAEPLAFLLRAQHPSNLK